MEHFIMCTCGLTDNGRRVPVKFRRVLASAPFVAVMRPLSTLLPSPHWCKLAADFYPTVKAALRHESADSEEDREGSGCHLGQGLYESDLPTLHKKTWLR